MVISILGCNQAASTEYRVPSTRYGRTTLPLSSLKDLFHVVNNILYCERSHNIIILSLPIIYFLVALYSKLDSAINCIVNTQKFLDVILMENLRDLSAFCPY